MLRPTVFRGLAVGAGVAAVYFVAGKLGLRLAFVNASATLIWAPTGIALSVFLLLGYRLWPAILLGAFLVNYTTAGTAVTSLTIAIGNTLEGIVGAHLIRRFANGQGAFDRAQDIFKFSVLAAIGSTAIAATIGATDLALAGLVRWDGYWPVWVTWWMGDAAGALVVTPMLVLWMIKPRFQWTPRYILEAVILLLCLFLVGGIVFGKLSPGPLRNSPLEFLCIPILVWTAFRFTPREAATALFVLAGIAIWGTMQGFGPFVRANPNESLLLLQTFSGVTTVTILALAAVVSEQRQAQGQLQQLAVSDALTGLANYRRLMEVLEQEVNRIQRAGGSFAVVLLDLDGLKVINDKYGHLVGSRALRRVANVLRLNCRNIDTAARFGGDEFALLLPDTDAATALQVVERIGERLKADSEKPSLSASFGVSEYPKDGATIEKLLEFADRALYEMKGLNGRRR